MNMTKSLSAVLLTICSLTCFCTAAAQGQKRRAIATTIREVKNAEASVPAPRACLAVFHEFLNYLQKSDTNIVRDEAAQKRWLTRLLRMEFAQKLATFPNPADDPDYPSNATFIGAWDYPSTYAVAATRRYGPRAVIDVLYKWGPNTNYAGDQRTTSFVFLYEDGAWKLDDIYTFRGAYVSAESLSQYFREK
jgi:hypothetical protein